MLPCNSKKSIHHFFENNEKSIRRVAHVNLPLRTQITGSIRHALFVWLISHQPAVLFSQNKSATSNQPTLLFSHNKSAPAISHQPNEQTANLMNIRGALSCFR
jgi:hypothetical protein